MEFKIYNNKKETIAQFVHESDRDACFDYLFEIYPDSKLSKGEE